MTASSKVIHVRILILSHVFPPSNSIAAQRTWHLRKALLLRGHKVLTITSTSTIDSDPMSPVVFVVDPIENLAQRLKSRRSIESASDPNFQETKSTLLYRLKNRLIRFAHSILAATGSQLLWPDRQALWARSAYKVAHKNNMTFNADIVIASAPPISLFSSARKLALNFDIPWVADYRDFHSISTYFRHGNWRRRVDRKWEGSLLSSASLVTVVSEPMVLELDSVFGIQAQVVTNGYAPEDFDKLEPIELSGRFKIVYTGSLYGGLRDFGILFDCLADRIDRNQWRIHYFGADGAILTDQAKKANLPGLVLDHGLVKRDTSLRAQISADLLLLVLKSDSGEKGVLTGKLFDYIGAQRPILMLGYTKGAAAGIIGRLPESTLGGSKSAVRQCLDAIAGVEAKKDCAFSGDDRERYTRKFQSRIWVDHLEELVANN